MHRAIWRGMKWHSETDVKHSTAARRRRSLAGDITCRDGIATCDTRPRYDFSASTSPRSPAGFSSLPPSTPQQKLHFLSVGNNNNEPFRLFVAEMLVPECHSTLAHCSRPRSSPCHPCMLLQLIQATPTGGLPRRLLALHWT